MSALPQNSTSGQRTLANKEGLRPLQKRIGYRFRDLALLELALVHPSSLNELPRRRNEKKQARDGSNQRLEFLGDSVLQLILSEALYRLYPEDREGALSTKRFALVKGSALSALAREIALYDHIRVGQSERTNTTSGTTSGKENSEAETGGAAATLRDSILEDAFEALVAALYLDSDLDTTREVVLRLYGDLAQKLAAAEPDTNPKGRLQERVQLLHGNDALHYEVIATNGEAHAREFEVALSLRGERLATGRGSSKQRAEEAAARAALVNWTDTP